jgi:hypothetical protein
MPNGVCGKHPGTAFDTFTTKKGLEYRGCPKCKAEKAAAGMPPAPSPSHAAPPAPKGKQKTSPSPTVPSPPAKTGGGGLSKALRTLGLI